MVRINEKYAGWSADYVSDVYGMVSKLKKMNDKLEVEIKNGVMTFNTDGKRVDLFLSMIEDEDLADAMAVSDINKQ